jgi:hypothetical protein
MPEQLERRLRRQAKARGYSKVQTNRYVYGTMRRSGWKPGRRRRKRRR